MTLKQNMSKYTNSDNILNSPLCLNCDDNNSDEEKLDLWNGLPHNHTYDIHLLKETDQYVPPFKVSPVITEAQMYLQICDRIAPHKNNNITITLIDLATKRMYFFILVHINRNCLVNLSLHYFRIFTIRVHKYFLLHYLHNTIDFY